MKLDKNTYEKIDNYLFGLMNEAEQQQFEQTIDQNEELSTAVALQKLEHRTMQLLTKKDLQANLNEWKKEKFANTTVTSNIENQQVKVVSFAQRTQRKRRFMYAAAAAFALLVAAFFGNQWANQNYSSEVLAENSFSTTISKERSFETGNYPTLFQPVITAMATQDYEKALQLLTEIDRPEYLETAKILQAENYFQLQQFNNAITVSRQVAQSGTDESNIEKAEWYLVLAYFAAERPEDARPILGEILANKNHALYPAAVKLNEELESFWGNWVN